MVNISSTCAVLMNLHAPYSMHSNCFEIRKVVLVEDMPVLQQMVR